MTLVVHLLSPNDRYDEIYLRNYATLNVKDELSRLTGVGRCRSSAVASMRCASGSIPTKPPHAV
jgi:multidrug efflux pump subunit AcrB